MARELILLPKAKYDMLMTHNEGTQNKRLLQDTVCIEEQRTLPDRMESTLQYVIPKNGYRKTLGLFRYLQDQKGSTLDWNDHCEITIHGQVVPGIHLIDLVKYTVSSLSTKEPIGYGQFYQVLKEMHTPTGFIA